jgi:hypothetical protein
MGQKPIPLLVRWHLQKWKNQLPLAVQPNTSRNDGDLDAYRYLFLKVTNI